MFQTREGLSEEKYANRKRQRLELKNYAKSLTLFISKEMIYICSSQPTESKSGGFLGLFSDGPVIEICSTSASEKLQASLMQGFKNCNQYFLEEFSKRTAIERHLKVRSWKKATNEKKCVTVMSNIEGYHITSYERMKSGRYLSVKQFYLTLDKGNKDNVLAEEVIKAMKISSSTLLDRKTKRLLSSETL